MIASRNKDNFQSEAADAPGSSSQDFAQQKLQRPLFRHVFRVIETIGNGILSQLIQRGEEVKSGTGPLVLEQIVNVNKEVLQCL